MLPNKKYTPADFVDIARRRFLFVVVPAAFGLFLALVVSSRIPNVYQAETLIQIVPQRVPDSYVRSTVTIKTEDRLDALGQQVLSRTQLERMILNLDLYSEERRLRPMQDVVEKMKAAVTILPIKPSRIDPVDAFYIRFKYSDPLMAARVTERLGTSFVDYNARERGALADGTNEFLERQLTDATTRLNAQEAKLRQFRERHAGKLPTQLQFNMQAIQSTQMQRQALVESLARDRDRKLMLERLYNDAVAEPPVARMVQTPPTGGTAATGLPPRQQLDLARDELAQLQLRLKEGHPDLSRARRRVADLEKQVAEARPEESATVAGAVTPEELQRRERISSMRAEIASLESQISFKESEERRLSGVINEYQARIEAVPGVESEWLSLTRDYETLQTTHRELLTKAEAARAAVDLESRRIGEQFRVLDAPTVPGTPDSPQRLLFSGGGLFGGAALGIVLIVLLELKDGSIKTETDVRQVLTLPVLAVVPNLLTDFDRRRIRLRRVAASSCLSVVFVAVAYAGWRMQLWKFIV